MVPLRCRRVSCSWFRRGGPFRSRASLCIPHSAGLRDLHEMCNAERPLGVASTYSPRGPGNGRYDGHRRRFRRREVVGIEERGFVDCGLEPRGAPLTDESHWRSKVRLPLPVTMSVGWLVDATATGVVPSVGARAPVNANSTGLGPPPASGRPENHVAGPIRTDCANVSCGNCAVSFGFVTSNDGSWRRPARRSESGPAAEP